MKRFWLTAIIVFVFLGTYAQRPTNNPFSRFGVGELVFQGFGPNIAMGHTGIASYSRFHFSKLNPASYSAFGRNHVVFDFGFSNKLSQFVTQDSSVLNNVSDITFIAGAFPITRWLSMSFGIIPYSGIGYTIEVEDSLYDDVSGTKIRENYDGSGGINQVYIGNSIRPIRNLSLGYNLYYRWGTMDRNSQVYIKETAFTSNTTIKKTLVNSGFSFDLGVLFNDTIINSEKRNVFEYTIGAIYSPASTLHGHALQYIARSTSYYSNNFVDTLSNDTLFAYSIPLAQYFGVGVAFKIKDQLRLEFNYYQEQWQGLNVLDQNNLQNSELFAFGMQYCRDPFSSRYLKTIRFRLGGFYHKTYLNINNTQIFQYGVTFGFGFPTKSSIINTSFELGTKGTLDNNLFKENYFLFNLDLTIHDLWFIRRRFL